MPYYLRSQKSLKSTLDKELLTNESTSDNNNSDDILKDSDLKNVKEDYTSEETEE